MVKWKRLLRDQRMEAEAVSPTHRISSSLILSEDGKTNLTFAEQIRPWQERLTKELREPVYEQVRKRARVQGLICSCVLSHSGRGSFAQADVLSTLVCFVKQSWSASCTNSSLQFN